MDKKAGVRRRLCGINALFWLTFFDFGLHAQHDTYATVTLQDMVDRLVALPSDSHTGLSIVFNVVTFDTRVGMCRCLPEADCL